MKNETTRPSLNDPEIVTYDKTELTVDTAYAVVCGSPVTPSSRRIKKDFSRQNVRRVLLRVASEY